MFEVAGTEVEKFIGCAGKWLLSVAFAIDHEIDDSPSIHRTSPS